VRPIDKQDEACTNADDGMVLGRHCSGVRVMHELAWIWTDFLSDEHQETGLVETRDISWAGGNDSLHDARARLKISSCARLKIS